MSMDFGAAVAGMVADGRELAEERMVDTWQIYTVSDTWTYNPTTGEDEQARTLLFETPARLKTRETVTTAEGGGRTIVSTRRVLCIPVSSAAVPVDAVAKCTAVHTSSDPTLLGVEVRLAGPAPGAQTVERRLEVVEVLT